MEQEFSTIVRLSFFYFEQLWIGEWVFKSNLLRNEFQEMEDFYLIYSPLLFTYFSSSYHDLRSTVCSSNIEVEQKIREFPKRIDVPWD